LGGVKSCTTSVISDIFGLEYWAYLVVFIRKDGIGWDGMGLLQRLEAQEGIHGCGKGPGETARSLPT
jgi:hypothetical protein